MTFTRALFKFLLIGLSSAFFAACGTRKYISIKNYPKERPFVYENKIEVKSQDLDKDGKSVLNDRLVTQLDDSMHITVKQSFVFFKRLMNPAVFDTSYAKQSSQNMEIFLKTIGYYNGKVTDTTYIDTVHGTKPQYRAITTFNVTTGPVFRMDSIVILPNDSSRNELLVLKELTYRNLSNSLLKKGDPFTEEKVAAEMDRLIELYRNNGYYNATRDLLYADVDTVFLKLLDPELALDPIRQFEVLLEAQERRKNPLVNVYIRTKPNIDTSAFRVYHNRNITVYPEFKNDGIDTVTTIPGTNIAATPFQTNTRRGISVKYKKEKFKPYFIRQHLVLRPDSIYRAHDVSLSADELNKLNLWQIIKIQPMKAKDDSSKIDYTIFLTPSKRYTFSTNLESVFNQVQSSLSTAGNLVGLGVNFGFNDRNIAKQGIQMSQTIRVGVELGLPPLNTGLQATELTYSNTLSLPKIPGWFYKNKSRTWMNKKTFFTNTISVIDRNINKNGLFALTSITSTFGWQFQTKKDAIWRISPLNIEYVKLYDISTKFQDQLDTTPFLRNSFNQGFVLGNVNINYSKPQIILKNETNNTVIASYRINFEESGAVFGRLKKAIPLFDKELFEYVKLDAEYKFRIIKLKREWVFRAAAGAGYLYDNDTSSMPFFKQFAGGGPYSMRGWPLRSIGPGASPMEPRSGRNQFFSRTGDMLFEINAEYRYDILSIWPNSLILRGALFMDAGNVWNMRNNGNRGNDTAVFQLNHFYRDMSVSAGTGLRLDFVGLFLLRVDFGLRVKNPAFPFVEQNAGWRFPTPNLKNLFGRTEADRNWRYENFNISLGIGYPF